MFSFCLPHEIDGHAPDTRHNNIRAPLSSSSLSFTYTSASSSSSFDVVLALSSSFLRPFLVWLHNWFVRCLLSLTIFNPCACHDLRLVDTMSSLLLFSLLFLVPSPHLYTYILISQVWSLLYSLPSIFPIPSISIIQQFSDCSINFSASFQCCFKLAIVILSSSV